MKITNDRKAVQNRATRYLNSKEKERQRMEDIKMDNFMCFISGAAVAIIIGCGYELYIMGAL
jgi:hypothetical protein|tara:strand:- start:41 stop:226 length:186 start_codon:yes stop_codon:yes gene_type:complete